MAGMIREALVSDLKEIFYIGERFYNEMDWPEKFNEESFIKYWTIFINSKTGTIFILEEKGIIVGILGALLYIDPMTGSKHAQEIFWYVSKNHRGRGFLLLKAYDEWQMKAQCMISSIAHMLNFMPQKLNKVYKRYGYLPVEVHYRKEAMPCQQE
jgi:hypothetical protein